MLLVPALMTLLLTACGPSATTPITPTATAVPAPTAAAVAPTEAPTVAAEAPTTAPTAGFGAAWTPEPCASFDVAEPLVARSDCGYVTVPERHAGGERTIELAVVRVRASAEQPAAPLVVGTGGPGGQGFMLTSTQAYSLSVQLPSLWGGILAAHDVVFFSQRGTRYARPDLVCPAVNAANYEAALNRLGPEERVAKAREGLQACVDAFTAQGVDLAAYTSDENAADIVSIAETLGYDKIFYYGQSYGTILGQFLIRNHPAILEGVILDGIMPVSFRTYDQQVDIVRSFRTTFEACATNAACNAAYPDLEAVLSEVYARLQANPQTVAVDSEDGQKAEVVVNGFSVIDSLLLKAYTNPTALPAAIYALKGLDPAAVATYAPQPPGELATSDVMHFAVNCSDDPITSLDGVDLQAVPEVYREFVTDDLAKAAAGCAVVQVPQLPAASDELARSDVPALLLSGALDPATLAPLSKIVA
ncbi:MAG: alpha/beta hydrolase, partial [Chloroflexales bacterium]|nr:alpha/beta hydrolase [Chloroflexales bacterium]